MVSFRQTWELESLAEATSTQEVLAARMEGDPRGGLVVVAERQTAGRGRRGRRWESPPGGLWFSFSLMLEGSPDPFLGLILAAAVRDALASWLGGDGQRLAIQWPNDLVVDERKWAGVLAEASAPSPDTSLLLMGAGVNLGISPEELARIAAPAATSILVEFGRSPSPREALSLILARFDELREEDRFIGREHSLRELARNVETLGRPVRWIDPNRGELRGVAEHLEPDGGLRVCLPDGNQQVLRSGEIHHLRSQVDHGPSQ